MFYIVEEVKPKHILSIGVESFTSFYHHLFRRVKFETIDRDSSVARWGSPVSHVIADATQIATVWQPNTFDAVLFNGGYGWGINNEEELRAVLHAITVVLKPNGFLLFGWNQTAELDPLDVEHQMGKFFTGYRICKLNGREFLQFKEWERHRYRFFQVLKDSSL